MKISVMALVAMFAVSTTAEMMTIEKLYASMEYLGVNEKTITVNEVLETAAIMAAAVMSRTRIRLS